jgi:hypothetical protein
VIVYCEWLRTGLRIILLALHFIDARAGAKEKATRSRFKDGVNLPLTQDVVSIPRGL